MGTNIESYHQQAFDWLQAPPEVQIQAGIVEVWRARLNWSKEHLAKSRDILSSDELERANRFKFQQHRNRYIVARTILRRLLGWYLSKEPSEVSFSYSQYHKPSLSPATSEIALAFNLAHSQDLAVFAFTIGRKVGIDVEHLRPLEDAHGLAKRFFARSEYRAWRTLSEHRRLKGFYDCWTRKEAFIKAVGEGLSFPLDQFEVTIDSVRPARLLTVRGERDTATAWSLYSLELGPKAVAALVISGRKLPVRCFEFNQRAGDPH